MTTTLTKESVIKSLQENPDCTEMLSAYIENRMKQVQAPYASREDTEALTFAFNIELAEIYRDAGLNEAAWDAYNDAADIAQANGMEEEYQALLVKMGEL
jgi:hypothetical protein